MSRTIDLKSRGIDQAEAAKIRAQLAPFETDWDSPELDEYNDYDAAKSRKTSLSCI